MHTETCANLTATFFVCESCSLSIPIHSDEGNFELNMQEPNSSPHDLRWILHGTNLYTEQRTIENFKQNLQSMFPFVSII